MDNKQYSTRELFRRFAPYFKKYRFTLWMDLFCAALTTVCELVLPLIMRYITNEGLRDLDPVGEDHTFTGSSVFRTSYRGLHRQLLYVRYGTRHGREDRDGHAQRCIQPFAEAVQYLL